MSVVHSTRSAGVAEIAAEMDRRGAAIEQLEATLAAQLAGHALSAKQSTENLRRANAAEAQRDALLEACKNATAILRGDGAPGWGIVKDILNTAIAKAEGLADAHSNSEG